MDESFFERPILNSPYAYPAQHWELDEDAQPTNRIIQTRRPSELITPVPKPQRRRRSPGQAELGLSAGDGLSTAEQEYNPTPIINEIRGYVAAWIGPEFGIVSRPDLVNAARGAADAGFDVVIACAFNFDAHSAELDRIGRIPILRAA
jgi:hypothetical protein